MAFTGLDWVRNRQRALARAVLALFCLVWVQAALVPCAMAVVPDGMGMGEEHCVYCPEGQMPQSPDDSGVAPACLYPDGAQADQRTSAATPAFVAPLLVAGVFTLPAMADESPDSRRVSAHDPVPRLSCAVAYCRFLK